MYRKCQNKAMPDVPTLIWNYNVLVMLKLRAAMMIFPYSLSSHMDKLSLIGRNKAVVDNLVIF